MTSRMAGLGVLLAAAVAALGFWTIFAALALLPAVVAVLVPAACVDMAATGKPVLTAWRAPLGLVLGAAAGLTVLTLPDAPWSAAALPVLDGALHGWRHTLESTFPARPDAALMAFVPLLALLAGVIGLEWLRRGFAPLVTLVPSVAVVGLAQIFRASTGGGAVVLALGYGLAAALVLAASKRVPRSRRTGRGLADVAVLAVPVALVAALGAWATAAADPLHRAAFSVHDRFEVVAVPAGAVSPLTEVGGRLDHPDDVVFTARTIAPVDRWPLVVLDGFDGAGWTSSAVYRPLGAALDADPSVTVARQTYTADITLGPAADGPWLPTQARTLSVDGLRPAVDPATGTMLAIDRPSGASYGLRWQAPAPAPDQLLNAPLDGRAVGAVSLGDIPKGIVDMEQDAVSGAAPSFAAALKLESWFTAQHYTVASGNALPTGSGSAQVLDFLARSHRGTSEQFAAAYVLMARVANIPARLVVGFRQPEVHNGVAVVHNSDAFTWPEVAVAGVGWVPLDPTRGADTNPKNSPPTAQAIEAARQQALNNPLPVPSPALAPPQTTAPPRAAGNGWSVGIGLAAMVVALLLSWALGVPAAKLVQRVRRRRSPGAQAVVGAWLDTRDRLRDHGVPVGLGMTVRDVTGPASAVLNGSSGELGRLARCVDTALWSGAEPQPQVADDAWASARRIRRALARRPIGERAGAALRLRSLRAPRS